MRYDRFQTLTELNTKFLVRSNNVEVAMSMAATIDETVVQVQLRRP
jgi:hypothetical protein